MVITPSFQVGDGGSIPLICSNSSTHTANDGLSKIQFRTAGSRMLEIIARWCNGSTTVFGAVSSGSNPARVTIKFGSLK
jgi:hypothetical protein